MEKQHFDEAACYLIVRAIFDRFDQRDKRIAELEAENAELIRKLAEKLFKKDAPND